MIETKLLSKENGLATIEINISEDGIAEALESTIRKFNGRVAVPGFRKGKTPVPMLKRYLGMDAIYEETINTIVPKAYYQALDDLKLKPIADPEFEDLDNVDLEGGTGVTFKVKVTVEPEIKLFDYEDFKMEREERPVTDEDIDKQLEMIRKDYAQYIPTDRKEVQEGDLVTIDFKGFVDDVQFPGGTAEDSQLIVGSKRFIPGFEEQMVGMMVGVEKEITVTFPLDYHAADLVGKDAKFVILVKDIKIEELPEIDDEFAKDLTDVESLQELRDRIKHNMTHYAQNSAIRALGSKVLKHIIENSEIEVPELLIKNEVEDNLERLEARLAEQGVTLEKYMEVTKKTEEDIKEDAQKHAPESIKMKLVMDEIAKKNEQLYPMVHEVDHEISHLLEEQNYLSQEEKNKMQKDKKLRSEIAERIMTEKVLDFLGVKCDANPIPECETCKEAHAHHHHHDGECDCGHDHEEGHEHDENCGCDHEHGEDCDCDHDNE